MSDSNVGDGMGAFRGALHSSDMVKALDEQPEDPATLAAGVMAPELGESAAGLASPPLSVSASGFYVSGGGGVTSFARSSIAKAADFTIDLDAASLNKLQNGLADILVEAQGSIAGLPAEDRHAALAEFVSRNPGAQIIDGMISIDAVAKGGNGAALLADLQALGLRAGSAYGAMVGGFLPLDALDDMATLDNLGFARPVYSSTNVGAVTGQHFQSMNVDTAITAYQSAGVNGTLNGTGLTIGVMSDSFNTRVTALSHYAQDVTSGDLPAGVNVLLDFNNAGATDEGRGMAQAIYDIASGVNLAFHTGQGGQATFANGILALANTAHADIIVDDLVYFAEPMFQDGIIAQAVNTVTAGGAMYFSSAGNQGVNSWEGAFVDSGLTVNITSANPLNAGTFHLMDFDAGAGVDIIQKLTFTTTATVTFALNWDQPYFSANGLVGSASDLALIFFDAAGNPIGAVTSNNIGFDPIEIAQFNYLSGVAGVGIGLRDGNVAPGLMKSVVWGGARIDEYLTNSSTSFGHNNAANAVTVGASDWADSPRDLTGSGPYVPGQPFPYAEVFSSKGGTPILFDVAGNRLATPQDRGAVEITASDGGNNTFFGSDVGWDPDTLPNFYGTSQAAPNAAAIAALLMQKFPDATNAQILEALKQSAIDIKVNYNGVSTAAGIGVGVDATTGAGLIQADAAVQKLAAITNHAPVTGVQDLIGAVTELVTPVGNLTDSGVISFTDADGVWAHVVSSTGTPIGSVLGSLTASITQDTAADGSGGKVTWNYSVSAGAVEYLAAGQTKVESFTIVLDDQHGATITRQIDVTITGTGDAPVISVVLPGDSSVAALNESLLTASGHLSVTDTDLTDNVSPSVLSVVKSGVTSGLISNDAALKAMLSVSPPSLPADPGSTHNLNWAFNAGVEGFDYLDDGEVLTLIYTIRATDTGGLTADQFVIVTVTGSNDAPTLGIVSASDSASASLDDGAIPLIAHGTLTAVDPDMSDSLNVAVTQVLASSGPTPPPGLLSMLSVSPLALAANPGPASPGNLGWTFSAGANSFDYLAAGQSQTFTYRVVASDNNGVSVQKDLSITVTGTNEAPVISGSVPSSTAVVELADGSAGEGVAAVSAVGTITFSDSDVSDTHGASFVANGSGYLGTFSLGPVNQAADKIDWTFSVADAALNGLAQGASLHQSYTVTLSDGHGGTSNVVVSVDLIGSNDAAVLSTANVVVTQGTAPVTASGRLTITDEDNPALFQALTNSQGSYGKLTLAANGSWSYLADGPLLNIAAGQVVTDSFTVHAVDGTPTTVSVSIAGSNDVAIARMDSFTTGEATTLGSGLSLFADNGSGADNDPDGPPLSISAVNGDAAFVGQQIHLASGALLTVNANGTFSYDPNHAFDSLTQASGAANQSGFDNFTYTLAGGTTATVFVNVNGVSNSGDQLAGNAQNNVITGFDGVADSFRFEQGGSDTGYGLGGNDGFYFGSALDGSDHVDGGDGTDTLAIQGNTSTHLGDIGNVEVILALSGSDSRFGDVANNRYDYDLTTNDANVAAGKTLTVSATGLLPGEDMRFDGSAETDGNFRIFAGQGNDALKGGAGSDGFFFGADGNLTGADRVDGGAGIDTLVLRGNYVGAGAVAFQNATMTNVEVLAFLSGHSNAFGGPIAAGGFDYDVTLADGNVAGGQRLDVNATGLGADESLRFDGHFETDGSFRILAGAGDDNLIGGSGGDQLYGGLGADRLEGGAGADIYSYLSAAESTSTHYDTIVGFDWHVDRIDSPGGIRAFAQSAAGALSTASFDADLSAGLNGVLGAGQAALFSANSGSLAGHVFAVIDGNGVAGYQAGEDLVIELVTPVTPIDPVAGVIL